MIRLNALQLRQLEEERARGIIRAVKRRPIYFILEDIYDTYNVGGLFRLADALAIERIYLVGHTETPPNSKIKKAAIGTDKIVPWEYKKTVKEVIDELKDESAKIFHQVNSSLPESNSSNIHSRQNFASSSSTLSVIAVEQAENSIDYRQADYSYPLALIFGNESLGVKKETLALCDKIVEIPMYGVNKSLNVIVAAAIVSHWIVAQE
jgi:tRNA G18 (ribose-2'-O)-methylase SpoU